MDARSPEAPGGEALSGAVSGDPGPPRVLEPRPGGNWGRVAGGRPHLPGARKPARAETPRPGKPETKVGPCVLRKRRHDVQTEPAVYETFCAIFVTRDSSGADGQAWLGSREVAWPAAWRLALGALSLTQPAGHGGCGPSERKGLGSLTKPSSLSAGASAHCAQGAHAEV